MKGEHPHDYTQDSPCQGDDEEPELWNPANLLLLLIFFFGLGLLVLAIILHLHCIGVFKLLFPPEGLVTIRIHNVNSQIFTSQPIPLPIGTNYVDMDISFEGNLTNGFMDTRVDFDNGEYLFYPDRESYIGEYNYQQGRPAVLGAYDTGLLQGRWTSIETIRTLRFYIREDPASPYPFLGQTVRQLVIGLYEDPLFLPSFEPRGGLPQQPEKIRFELTKVIIRFT